MTIYNKNNVPVLFLGPDQKVGLSEEGFAELRAARDAAHEALYSAAERVSKAHDAGAAAERAYATAAPENKEAAKAKLDEAVDAALAAREAQGDAEAQHLLVGHSVIIHNKAPRGGTDEESKTLVGIGASDIDEAIKECISAFDLSHLGTPDESSDEDYPPDWVASSHELLGRLLADYYNCELRSLAEVL